MSNEYVMREFSNDGLQLSVYFNEGDGGCWELREWCKDNIDAWGWQAMCDYGNGKTSAVFRFETEIDVMAFKLRWS